MKLAEMSEIQMMHTRHLMYYVQLAEKAEPELVLQNQTYWLGLLRAEYDNLRGAVEWGAANDQSDSALRLVGCLLWFWVKSALNREALDLSLKALRAPASTQYPIERARALSTIGLMQFLYGEIELARQSLEEAVSIFKDTGREADAARSFQFLGHVYSLQQEYELADQASEEGLVFARKLQYTHSDVFLFFQGDLELQKGDFDLAEKIYEEGIHLHKKMRNDSFRAYPIRRLGYLALLRQDIATATARFIESLKLNIAAAELPGLTASLVSLAVLAIHQNQLEIAYKLFGAVEKRIEFYSVNIFPPDKIELNKIRQTLRTGLQQPDFNAAFSEGWEMNEDQIASLADQFSSDLHPVT
jgi:tetratricopeptide (TPR) repeat protein